MPVLFYSISTFRNSIEKLCNKEKDGYHSCKKDVCNLFKGLSFDDILGMNFRVRDSNNIRVIKIRVQNSFLNLSSSEGFRLIVCCNKKSETVNLLNIYPKKGKLGKSNQTPEEFKNQLKTYQSALNDNQLVRHNINKELIEL